MALEESLGLVEEMLRIGDKDHVEAGFGEARDEVAGGGRHASRPVEMNEERDLLAQRPVGGCPLFHHLMGRVEQADGDADGDLGLDKGLSREAMGRDQTLADPDIEGQRPDDEGAHDVAAEILDRQPPVLGCPVPSEEHTPGDGFSQNILPGAFIGHGDAA